MKEKVLQKKEEEIQWKQKGKIIRKKKDQVLQKTNGEMF